MPPKNTDPNRQRDHQANERTFLAWLRTSLALIGFGFAIARFGLFTRQIQYSLTTRPPVIHPVFNSENFGMGLVCAGVLTMLLATWHFNQVFQQIEHQDYRPKRFLMWFMTGLVLTLGAFSIPLILWRGEPSATVAPKPPQKRPSSLP
jgi:putative membrane protein